MILNRLCVHESRKPDAAIDLRRSASRSVSSIVRAVAKGVRSVVFWIT